MCNCESRVREDSVRFSCYERVQVSYKHLIKKSSRYVVEINTDNFESHKKRLRC